MNDIFSLYAYLFYHYTYAICISEFWLKSSEVNYFSFPNFIIVSRSNGHGGCLFIVHNNLNFKESTKSKHLNVDKHFEHAVIELTSINLILIFVYRSPDRNVHIFLGNLETVLKLHSIKGREIILCGDLIDLLVIYRPPDDMTVLFRSFNL